MLNLTAMPLEQALEVLRLTDNNGFTVAHTLAEYNGATLQALLTTIPFSQALEVLRFPHRKGSVINILSWGLVNSC